MQQAVEVKALPGGSRNYFRNDWNCGGHLIEDVILWSID
jgi:hypothetical protein